MPKTLYIIDGHSQIFRAYYAPFGDLTSPSGEPTRATHVFFTMLLRMIADHEPDYVAMAIDGPAEKLKRRAEYPEYKITRKPAPEDFAPQAKRIIQLVGAMGIVVLEATGYEADDILATAAEKFASPKLQVVLVSRDKDLDQLVGPNVILFDPVKNEFIDADAIETRKGYRPGKAVEVQSLMGDTSDNVPGIPGVGPKKAAALIGQYGSAKQVLEHAGEMTPKLKENLLKYADNIDLARRLVTLDRDVPIELDLAAMEFVGIRGESARPILAELGLNRLLEQLDALGVGGAEGTPPKSEPQIAPGDRKADYTCVDTPQALTKLTKKLSGVKRIGLDTETTSTQPMWTELVGISVAWGPGQAAYLPLKGPLGAKTLQLELVTEKLGPILANTKIEKVGHNLKFDLLVLQKAGIKVAGEMFDTIIAAHVLDSTRPSYKLDNIAAELLDYRCIPIEEVIGTGRNQITMDTAAVQTVTVYAAEDADIALRLRDVLAAQLKTEGLTDLFQKLEMPLLPVLTEMERCGIRVDPQILKQMEQELSVQADVLRDRIIAAAGRQFNVDSPKQLAQVLFEELGLPVIKRKKTGPSTDADVLEQLAVEHQLAALVLDYRQLTKLLSTYLAGLGQRIHPVTRRVHTSFRQTGTSTGRLSSSDPNLQNIPVRTKVGRQIRSAFIAAKGCVLLSADYSQVELRVLAHLCADETLVDAFLSDQDIHRIVAAEVFGVKLADVTDDQRARAKTVNFGIIYGQTAFGLSRTLRIPRSEAGEFIKRYRKRFVKIDQFLGTCVKQAKDNGYVETIMGRRRRIPHIGSNNATQRAHAERLAINSVVQGSAADIIKQAMINIAAQIRAQSRPSVMLLQIHDELVFEIPRKAVKQEREMIVSQMSGAVTLNVPLKVDVGVGNSWMDAK